MSLNAGNFSQHVLSEQLPLTPWHLHSFFNIDLTICTHTKQKKGVKKHFNVRCTRLSNPCRRIGTTHFSTGFVIMQIHQAPCVSFGFSRVGESFSQRRTRSDVSRTAAPFPSVWRGWIAIAAAVTPAAITVGCGGVVSPWPMQRPDQLFTASFGRIATARADSSLAARLRDSVSQTRAPHCIQISCFAASWIWREEKQELSSTWQSDHLRSLGEGRECLLQRFCQMFFFFIRHWKTAILPGTLSARMAVCFLFLCVPSAHIF